MSIYLIQTLPYEQGLKKKRPKKNIKTKNLLMHLGILDLPVCSSDVSRIFTIIFVRIVICDD